MVHMKLRVYNKKKSDITINIMTNSKELNGRKIVKRSEVAQQRRGRSTSCQKVFDLHSTSVEIQMNPRGQTKSSHIQE